MPAELRSAKSFQEVIEYIDNHYHFKPCEFKYGELLSGAGQNNGSCKVFAFAELNQLSPDETLNLFSEHYQEVLNNPEGNNHQNIRNFMKYGWEGISFSQQALSKIK